jgi:hypothetical protein
MFELMQFFLAVVAAYAYAIVAAPLLRMPARLGRFTAVCAALLVWLCPLLIAPEKMIFRAIAAFLCGELFFKMIDYSRQYRRRHGKESADYGAYLRFLIPFPTLLVVFGERERRRLPPPPLREIAIVCLMGCLIAAGFFVLRMAARVPAIRSCFPLDHAVMLIIFVITIASLSRLMWGMERLARFDTRPIIDGAFLATTPGEFWNRYNTRVGEWLHRNVFQPSGGGRAPMRGVFLSFFASAVFHEAAFAIATSRFTGYQFTFFMVQAPAVALSHWLGPSLRQAGPALRIAARYLTVLWFYGTSIFFFEGVDRTFHFFYASRPWLP